MPASGNVFIPNPDVVISSVSHSNPTPSVVYIDSAASGYGTSRVWSGNSTPNFGALGPRQRLILPVNSFSQTRKRMKGSMGIISVQTFNGLDGSLQAYTYTTVSDCIIWNSSSPFSLLPPSGGIEEARKKARGRLAKEVGDMQVNVAQFIGERAQTAKLLADTARRIFTAARLLRKGDLLGVYGALQISTRGRKADRSLEFEAARVRQTPLPKRLANHWLEYQYGWKPLLQDAFGAAELLAKHVANEPCLGFARATGKHKLVKLHSMGPGVNFNGYTAWDCKVSLSVRYSLENEGVAALSQTGILNPALLAWELLPFSFVVDWFIPVGNYLQSLQAFDGFSIHSGSESVVAKGHTLKGFTSTSGGAGPGQTLSVTGGSCSVQEDLFTRVPISSWPPAIPPSFRCPLGGDPLSRLTTATALGAQLFKKRG